MTDSIPCPHCGEPLSERATSCRHCGSDSDTGWHEDVEYASVDLGDESPETDEPSGFVQLTAWVCLFAAALLAFRGRWWLALLLALGFVVFRVLRQMNTRSHR